jgi:hypothetical protein
MRSIIPVGLCCLAMGILGALGYSHYLGEGKQLADLQDELSATQASLAKVTQESHDAKSETAAMSAQIQQLSATKEDLTKQLDAQKSGAPATSIPMPPGMNPSSMAGIMKSQFEHINETKLQLLKTRLHLTPDQEAAVRAAMDAETKRMEDMTSKMFAGGKVDPQAMAAELKGTKTTETTEQTLNAILTPDQKTAYQQMKTEQQNSSAETSASIEMNQVAPLLQLNDSQKDQVENALYQVQLNSQDPAWIKQNVTTSATNPLAVLDAEAKAKEDALSKVLTPDQLAAYQQQAQSQLDMQKSMMQRFMPAPAATPAPAAAPAPAQTP